MSDFELKTGGAGNNAIAPALPPKQCARIGQTQQQVCDKPVVGGLVPPGESTLSFRNQNAQSHKTSVQQDHNFLTGIEGRDNLGGARKTPEPTNQSRLRLGRPG